MSSGNAYRQPETGSVLSTDGLKIGSTKFGHGPAVVIVHRSYSVQENWFKFAHLLADNYTVYVYDRRERGRSLDKDNPFSFQMEVNDLAAVVNVAGKGAAIVAHSYGGAITSSYLLQVSFEGHVVFYEPINGILDTVSQGLLPHVKSLVADGKLDETTVLTQTKIVRFDLAAVEASKRSPSWYAFTQMTEMFLREVEALDNFNPSNVDTDKIKANAFLLLGTETPHGIRTCERSCGSQRSGNYGVSGLQSRTHRACNESGATKESGVAVPHAVKRSGELKQLSSHKLRQQTTSVS